MCTTVEVFSHPLWGYRASALGFSTPFHSSTCLLLPSSPETSILLVPESLQYRWLPSQSTASPPDTIKRINWKIFFPILLVFSFVVRLILRSHQTPNWIISNLFDLNVLLLPRVAGFLRVLKELFECCNNKAICYTGFSKVCVFKMPNCVLIMINWSLFSG